VEVSFFVLLGGQSFLGAPVVGKKKTAGRGLPGGRWELAGLGSWTDPFPAIARGPRSERRRGLVGGPGPVSRIHTGPHIRHSYGWLTRRVEKRDLAFRFASIVPPIGPRYWFGGQIPLLLGGRCAEDRDFLHLRIDDSDSVCPSLLFPDPTKTS